MRRVITQPPDTEPVIFSIATTEIFSCIWFAIFLGEQLTARIAMMVMIIVPNVNMTMIAMIT